MISTPQDAVLLYGILAGIIVLSAGIIRSAIAGAFGGVLFILIGAYGLTNDIGFGVVNDAISLTLIFFGVFILFNASISVLGGGG